MVLIALVVIVNSQLSPYFLDVDNLFRASSDFIEMGLMMLPMVFIIVTGNVDLAVASTLGMTASFMGLLFNNGLNIWIAAGAALLLGTLAGLLERLSHLALESSRPGDHPRHVCVLSRPGLRHAGRSGRARLSRHRSPISGRARCPARRSRFRW